jgi:hypothetical protein
MTDSRFFRFLIFCTPRAFDSNSKVKTLHQANHGHALPTQFSELQHVGKKTKVLIWHSILSMSTAKSRAFAGDAETWN